MKYHIVLTIALAFIGVSASCQSLFSVLRLNEGLDIHTGVPKEIVATTIFYNTNGTEERKEITRYDKWGLPKQQENYNKEGKIASIKDYTCDVQKRVILETKTDVFATSLTTPRPIVTYSYDSARSPYLIQYKTLSKQVLCEVLLKNNTDGLPLELQLYEPVDNLLGIEIANYLIDQNKAIISVANAQGKILSTDTSTISFRDKYKFAKDKENYNSNGDLIKSSSKWLNGDVHYYEYDYVYDAKGNWVEYNRYEVFYKKNGKATRKITSTFKRSISYWD